MTTAPTGVAVQQPPRPADTTSLPAADVLGRAGAVVADYDRVRTWSDPSARQCELGRLGSAAVDLLRQLATTTGGAGGRR